MRTVISFLYEYVHSIVNLSDPLLCGWFNGSVASTGSESSRIGLAGRQARQERSCARRFTSRLCVSRERLVAGASQEKTHKKETDRQAFRSRSGSRSGISSCSCQKEMDLVVG
jgi:hypothetical protein